MRSVFIVLTVFFSLNCFGYYQAEQGRWNSRFSHERMIVVSKRFNPYLFSYKDIGHVYGKRSGDPYDVDVSEPYGELIPLATKHNGRPVKPGSTRNTIKCQGGVLVVSIGSPKNIKEIDSCIRAHENVHVQDWYAHYGNNVCQGVSDGRLPVGGNGYKAFLYGSEIKAYQAEIDCLEDNLGKLDCTQEENNSLKFKLINRISSRQGYKKQFEEKLNRSK